MLVGVARVEVDVRGLDRELAALRHGITGVDREVHDHLLDLAGIRPHGGEVGREPRGELDVLAQQPAQHVLRFRHEAVQVDHFRLHHLLPAEGEQLAGEPRRAVGRLADLGDVFSARVGGAQVIQQQVGIAGDRREDVVEVVRHAAGQAPHSLHLLRLAQLLLQADALGDVARGAEDSDQLALAELGRGRELAHPIVALPGAYAQQAHAIGLPADGAAEQLERERHVVGVDELLERLAKPLLARPTEGGFERRV